MWNLTLEQAIKAKRGSRGIAWLFFKLGAEKGDGCSKPRTGRFTPGKETRYPLYKMLKQIRILKKKVNACVMVMFTFRLPEPKAAG
jgi:hypothetical protein